MVVSTDTAHLDLARRGNDFLQHALCRFLAKTFQPADVYILQHWIGGLVRVSCCGQAVEAHHLTIQAAALKAHGADTLGEVWELGPHVQFGVGQVRVVVGFHTQVLSAIERADVRRLPVLRLGVGAACNRPAHTQTELFAHHVPYRDHVDAAQKIIRFLHLVFQLLLGTRRDVERLCNVFGLIRSQQAVGVCVPALAGQLVHFSSLPKIGCLGVVA
ncbi:hypothetical protein D3C72_1098340 [compost metagenome]